MKTKYSDKVSIAVVALALGVVGVSFPVKAQSTGVRAVGRSNASNSPAEQVRRDANSINCHALGHLETRYGVNWPQSNRYQTVCNHGRPSKGRATRY